MANRHVERYSASLIIREMHVKTIMGHHLTPVSMAVIRKTEVTSAGKDVEERSPRALWVELQIGASTVEDSMDVPQKIKNTAAI